MAEKCYACKTSNHTSCRGGCSCACSNGTKRSNRKGVNKHSSATKRFRQTRRKN